MNEANTQVRQRLLQLRRGGLRGLRLQCVALLDQGTDPVGLSTVGTGGGYPFNHLLAPFTIHQRCTDRLSSRRQFIDD